MAVLYFDTATTRFRPNALGRQRPHLMRLAWALDDEAPRSHLVRVPTWVTTDPDTVGWHGITKDDTLARGADPQDVLGPFIQAALRADRTASFNAEFHREQIRLAMEDAYTASSCREITRIPAVCLMLICTPLCRLPSKRHTQPYAYPSLAKAVEHVTGDELVMPADVIERGAAIIGAIRALHRIVS